MSTSSPPSSFIGLSSSLAPNKSFGPSLAQGPTSEEIQSRVADHSPFAPILITVSLPCYPVQCSQSQLLQPCCKVSIQFTNLLIRAIINPIHKQSVMMRHRHNMLSVYNWPNYIVRNACLKGQIQQGRLRIDCRPLL